MSKCHFCGNNVFFPFVCNYCGLKFCPEHRLPEAHDCVGVPEKKFWYQKQRQQIQKQEVNGGPHSSFSFINRKKRMKYPLAIAYIVMTIGFFLSLFLSYSIKIDLSYLTYSFEILGFIVFFYFLFKRMDRISLTSDMRLWGLRILAGIVVLFGFFMFLVGIFEAYYLSIVFRQSMQVMTNVVITFFDLLGMGFILLGSFLIFKFMRRSGVIIYHG